MNLAYADENNRKVFDQLTSREIDVVSCLLENSASKKIGAILGITGKAVDTHISNISQKLGKYGRPTLVDYIKKSIDVSELRKRYCNLVSASEFQKILKKIKQQVACQGVMCKIACKDNVLKKRLASDLQTLDITCFERKKEIQAIQIQPRDNYFQTFFEMLYQIAPHPLIEEAIKDFASEKQQGVSSNAELTTIRSKEGTDQQNVYLGLRYVKRYRYAFLTFIIACCLIFTVNTYFSTKTPVIRSDLPIPIDVYCLDRPQLAAEISGKFNGMKGIQTVVIVGQGGMGKTTVTHQYARTKNFPIVWEINAEDQKSILSSFEQLAFAMAKTFAEEREIDRIKKIENEQEYRSRLLRFVQQKLVLQKQWLLIFDNVDNFSDIQSFFPNDIHTWGNGRILITTRNDHIKCSEYIHTQNIVHITPLSIAEQTELFSKIISGKNERSVVSNKDLENFLRQIPPFPLDVAIAAQYIKNTGARYNDYVKKLSLSNDDFEKSQNILAQEMTPYAKTRYNIIACTMEHLIKSHPEFTELLLLICAIGSQNIPKDLLLLCKKESIIEEFIAQMCRYSLLTHTAGSGQQIPSISMHRSTQQKLSIYLYTILKNDEKRKYFDRVTYILEQYCLPAIKEFDVLKMRGFSYHLQIFLGKSDEMNLENCGIIESLLGYMYFRCFGNPLKARTLLAASLNHLPTYYHKNIINPHKPRAMTYAGIVERNCGNFVHAKKLLEKSVQLYDTTPSSNKSDLALALRYLSSVYRFMTEFDKAKTAIDRSIDIYQKFDKNSVDLASAFVELAFLYHYGANDNQKALHYLSKSLSMLEKTCGPYHLQTLWVRGTLGMLLKDIGRYKEAFKEIKASYDSCMERYPYVFSQFNWIMAEMGNIYLVLGCYKQSESLLIKSVENQKKYYGHHNAIIVPHLIDFGLFYWETGNYQKAKELLEASLEITLKGFGEEHWRMCLILHYLSLTYASLGNHKKSQELFEKCLALYDKKYRYKHAERAIVLRDFGQFHIEKQDYTKAEQLIREALMILEKAKHPERYKCYEYLGNLYVAQGQRDKAKAAYKKALSIAKIYFPKNSAYITRLKSKIPFMQRCLLFARSFFEHSKNECVVNL